MQYRSLMFGVTFLVVILVACVPVEKKVSNSQNADYHYTLGLSSLNEQNPTEALKEFLEAEKYDGRDPRVQDGLAQAYWIKQAYDLAEKHSKNAIEFSNNDPKYYNNLAALYLTMGRYDDAISAFQTAADNLLFDRPELAWSGIGLANVQKQDYVAAQRAYEKAMELNPRYYMAPFRLGELFYNLDRPAEALEMFTRSVKLARNFARGYYWQGMAYMKMKDTEKAKNSFMEVLRLEPESESGRLAKDYLKIINK